MKSFSSGVALAIVLSSSWLVSGVKAASDSLVLTEYSSTFLAAVYNGTVLPVTLIVPDQWEVTLPSYLVRDPNSGDGFRFAEPENITDSNRVYWNSTGTGLDVFSEGPGFGGVGPVPILPFAIDTSTGDQVSLVFRDLGDATSKGQIYLCAPCSLLLAFNGVQGLSLDSFTGQTLDAREQQRDALAAELQQALNSTLLGDNAGAFGVLQDVESKVSPPDSVLACTASASASTAALDTFDEVSSLIEPPDPCISVRIFVRVAVNDLRTAINSGAPDAGP